MDFELIEDDAYDPAPFLSYARLRSQERTERNADVGDIVHFWHAGKTECMAALVCGLDACWEFAATCTEYEDGYEGGSTALAVWDSAALPQDRATHVHHDEKKSAGGTWHWPCGGR